MKVFISPTEPSRSRTSACRGRLDPSFMAIYTDRAGNDSEGYAIRCWTRGSNYDC
jgi:hypothetical protein